jgi:aminobenzoyl-glutamate utilization protein B
VGAQSGNLGPEKAFCFDYLERNAGAIATLNDSIFYFAELGMQELETSKLMCELLEEGGFRVERGISGFASGFCATCGSGEPVVAIHTEYDANPDNSQASGVAEQRPIVEGAPGHCEGHNTNGAVLVAAALAVKAALDKFGLDGTLKVFGAPAEEQLISRPYYVRDGWFDDVDVAFADHIGSGFSVGYGLIQSALISATFTFHGETAHAGVAPWKGRDALDGVVLMDMGLRNIAST